MSEWKKARTFYSDAMSSRKNECGMVSTPSQNGTIASYGEVVRELLNQIDCGCDLIPIDKSFGYEELMSWVRKNAVGNNFFLIKDELKNTTGQVIAAVFAEDDVILLSKDKPKCCFVYKELNITIQDLFPKGIKVYNKPFKFV